MCSVHVNKIFYAHFWLYVLRNTVRSISLSTPNMCSNGEIMAWRNKWLGRQNLF